MIAVHVGAGFHSQKKSKEYRSACKVALTKAIECLKTNTGNATAAVTKALTSLENDPCTNAGIGSNLTLDGTVECDASLMCGKTHKFGAVASLSGIQNPVQVCKKLIDNQNSGRLSLGRVLPCVLSGPGAHQWSIEQGLPHSDSLVTKAAFKTYQHHRRRLDREEFERSHNGLLPASEIQAPLDTVGAVCVDLEGHVSAAVSSGGILLKQPGRVGQASVYGCGCWAENYKDTNNDDYMGIATTTSGCGEHLLYTQLAQKCALKLKTDNCSSQAVSDVMKESFLNSPFLLDVEQKYGGLLCITTSKSSENSSVAVELIWCHTTDSMALGFMTIEDSIPKTLISRLSDDSRAGHSFVMEGKSFHLTSNIDAS